ncbi:metal ABC transporter permease [Pseudomonas argentinensis]|uniref:Zinc transport system permease protein n=1 Tax=Phytopseudomonas argentinensis TaxID=289370 RepID=A0A1I3NLV0_9GAMM|nr:metal ABC transporter permease [Pseudomonas argentinensis]KAB0549919.1 metal ABC transporter permease [Pseudomonas argentinensis]SFJ09756.1 zinc transport system permease protein [Pseudomonas argentinensis]
MNDLYSWIRDHLQALAASQVLPQPFEYEFVINALLCALLIGPLLGVLGSMVMIKRMAFFSQSVGNAAMTGVAIGVLVGESYTSPYLSMFGFCLLFALTLKYTQHRTTLPNDTLIGVFLSISLAVGASLLLFVSAKINTHVMESVLFGSILAVDHTDMNVLLGVSALCALIGLPLYNAMLLASLNPSLAHARGVPVRVVEYLFVVLVTLVTVACLKIIGAVLVEALLLIPAAAARNISRSLPVLVTLAALIATFSCVVGILVPMQFYIPVPTGGAIVIAAALVFVLTTIIRTSTARFRGASV